ncbi:UvrD-helicase domain-containing protein [Chloroflexales bacterium ZM16-3]|nr:UvrD-helicase domain-containing protein [Chloroflexales bacterium ZM16-3]
MNLTDDQRRAIHSPGNLVAAAGAGSGKTRVLVERYVRLISAGGLPPDAVLAITFTEKAAREMRDRVRQAVEARARSERSARWEELRAAVESARIGTIHSFCAELLRAHPGESTLDPRFRILDEVESGIMLADSVDEALREMVGSGEASPPQSPHLQIGRGKDVEGFALHAFHTLLDEFGPAELRVVLADMLRGGGEVRAAIESLPPDAAALQAMWRDQLADARRAALAELLGSAAWRDAADTILGLAPVAPAADRLAAQLLAVAAWLAAPPADTAPDFALINAINLTVGSKKLWPAEGDLATAKSALKALREAYRAAAGILSFAPDPQIEARAAEAAIALRDLYALSRERYAANKARADALDFDDLEALSRDLLLRHPQVRRRWAGELRAIMVDEFQDTNEAQRAIIYALAGLQPAADPGPPAELFVVGDGKQSIYRFRGADVSVFQQVEQDIVDRGGLRVRMDISFRSHPHMLTWVNLIGAHAFARTAPLQSFETPFEPLQASRPDPTHNVCVELHVASGDGLAADRRAAEAALLARRLKELVERDDDRLIIYDRDERRWRRPEYGDIAILFRASSAFEPFEAALRAQGIPFLTTAGRGYYGRSEVRDLIHLLRVIDDPTDELALVGALRSPLFALDDATIVGLRLEKSSSLWEAIMADAGRDAPAGRLYARKVLAELQTMRGRATVAELLRAALERTGYLATISGLEDGERRRVNVEKLVAAARLTGARGLRAFSEYLEQLLRAETREGEAPLEGHGSVRLMTIHRSKGLEFPIVALPDLGRTAPPARERWQARPPYGLALKVRDPDDQERLPTAVLLARRAEAQMERAESDRLLYVSLTRAQDYLLLSGPALKSSGESWMSRIATALGHPWESGGPPAAPEPPMMEVFRHDAPT